MAGALIRGDVLAAWAANPLALVVAVLIGIRAVGWLIEVVRNPRAPSRQWLPSAWHRHWFAAFVAVSVAYVLFRNLFPLS